ncbi:isochorismatase family protein (plasmid) [Pseudoalteromonas sp. T1lg65]|uniref:isochorismatase family protein n=1 Tax=Pseudoalteromonas sp. T1lg65 TaxID=2077101 RepID=UPI003F7A547F
MNLNAQDCLVLVIDIQEKFRPHIDSFADVESNVETLLTAAEILGVPTLLFEQYPQGLGHSANKLLAFKHTAIEKCSFSAYLDNELKQKVKATQKHSLIVVGLETHICVQQTVNDLLNDSFNVVILADCVCSRNSKHTQWALSQMQADGARLMSLESALFQWLTSAKNPHFKSISNLIK